MGQITGHYGASFYDFKIYNKCNVNLFNNSKTMINTVFYITGHYGADNNKGFLWIKTKI